MCGPTLARSAVVALVVAFTTPVPAQSTTSSAATSEAAVKAGFVFHFGKFTEWPASALPNGQIQLCLIGQDTQGAVSAAIEGRAVQGRVMSVKRNPRGEELKTCQIIYVTDLDERKQNEVLRSVRNLPVLTIGDVEGFTEVGGMIGLGANGGRVSFDINNEVAQSAGLKFSSQLLKLATAVRGRTP